MRTSQNLDLKKARVLDGGFATELERRGVSVAGPLWSARALFEVPEAVLAVHRSYLQAGADVLLTGSYQASAMGFAAAWGLGAEAARQAEREALRRAVALAVEARAERTDVLIAASLGPYGAALANGAEFHGEYGFAGEVEQHEALTAFHAPRIASLANTEADLLAFETVPSLAEARAIAQVLPPDTPAWISFHCRDQAHAAHGEPVRTCAEFLDSVPQVVAVGVNCIAPALVLPLLHELRAGTEKPLLAYPNSGEGWDAQRRCWTGSTDIAGHGALARQWFQAGAQIVGGCCRTGPGHVRAVAEAAYLP